MKTSQLFLRNYFVFLFALLLSPGLAQIDYTIFDFGNEFEFSQHNVQAVFPSADGGYFVFGNVGDNFYADTSKVYVLETDAAGSVIWKNVIGTNDVLNYCHAIVKTPQDGFVMVGHHKEGTSFSDPINPMIAEFDQAGNLNWMIYHPWQWDDELLDVLPDYSGDGYIVIGTTASFGAGSPNEYNIFMMKTDANGGEMTKTVIDGVYDDFGFALSYGIGGGYLFAGAYESPDKALRDLFFIRTDENLNVSWTKLIDGSGYDYPNSIAITNDGHYIVTGETDSFENSDHAFLLKIDDEGDVKWMKTYGGNQIDYANMVIVTEDDHYLFCGKSGSSTPESQIYLVKADTAGNEVWSEIISYENGSSAYSVYEYSPGHFLLGGYFKTFSNDYQSIVVEVTDLASGIEENLENSNEFMISCFPNPFSDFAKIEYVIPDKDDINISVYNCTGNLVLILANKIQHSGKHIINLERNALAPGIYNIVLSTNQFTKTCKVVIVD
jgi:hypothetical protein